MLDRLTAALRSRTCLALIAAADVAYKGLAVVLPDVHGHGFDSDEAIVGLMGLRTLEHGEPALFFFGQTFGGGPEYLVTTLVFSVLEPSIGALRLAALAMRLASDALFYLILRGIFADRLQRNLALVLFIAMSAFFHGYLARFSGVHLNHLLLGLATVYLFCSGRRVLDRPVWKGLVIGLGLWVSNVIVLFLLPAVAVAAARQAWERERPRASELGALALLLAAVGVGCSPRLYYWMHPSSWHVAYLGGEFMLADTGQILARARTLLADTLPRYFYAGLSESPLAMLGTGVIALACLHATAAAIAGAVRRTPSFPALACLMAVFWLSLAALVANRGVYDEGLRYLVTLQPFAAVSVALLLRPGEAWSGAAAAPGAPRTLAVLGLVAFLSALGVAGAFAPPAERPEGRGAAHEEIIQVLDREGVQHGLADYWASYDIAFRSRERIQLVPFYVDRIAAYREPLAGAERKAWVFRVSAPLDTDHFKAALRANAAAFERLSQRWQREGTQTRSQRIGPYLLVVEAPPEAEAHSP